MIKFFQVVFLTAAVILIVLNVIEFNKWQEGRKEGRKVKNRNEDRRVD